MSNRAGHSDYKKYKAYYLAREASPEGERKRVERDQARTKEIKAGRLKGPHDPREVDHVRSLKKGGGNKMSNLRVISRTANRRKYD